MDVSRETLERLEAYAALLAKWQRAVNLVGTGTLPDLWRRHLLDSAQLRALLPPGATNLVDLGSGAGLPGLVLAILGAPDVHLVEADAKKCAFLREAARVTASVVTIHNARIEDLVPWPADVVTARALAPLPVLLGYAARFATPKTICLFLKGRGFAEELTESLKSRTMTVQQVPSRSDPSGTVLRLEGIARD